MPVRNCWITLAPAVPWYHTPASEYATVKKPSGIGYELARMADRSSDFASCATSATRAESREREE